MAGFEVTGKSIFSDVFARFSVRAKASVNKDDQP